MNAEDTRCLLNWLASRVDECGNVHPEHEHERRLIEPRLKLARELGLTVTAGAYLPRPDAPKPRVRKRRKAA